jgi:divalent metal cation (Fe/Co/Zn/Cd) transporter
MQRDNNCADPQASSSSAEMQSSRLGHLKRGVSLAAATVAWNLVEGIIALGAGSVASSIALFAFGADSFIETTSGAMVGWRFVRELRGESGDRAARIEKQASRVAGGLLLVLAVYIVIDAGLRLVGLAAAPRSSLVGIIVTVSLVVMPVLAWLKLRTARELGSRALRADAFETITCACLSATTLVGLAFNGAFGWTWADPLAALILVPMIAREGFEAIGLWNHDD